MRSAFYVMIHTLLALPARLLFRVHAVGRENEPRRESGPYLLCANHQTVLDVVFLCATLRHQQPHFMGKEGVFRVPLFGTLVRWLGAYPVARGRNDVGAVKHTIKLLQSGRSVGIFPQGTRCAGKDIRDTHVKAGVAMIAAHTQVPILPVYIGMKEQTWKFLRRVDVVIGKPMPFESFGYDKEKPGEYARISNEIFEEICRLGDSVKK